MQLKCPYKSNGFPIIYKHEFDDLAIQILTEYMPNVLKTPQALDIKYLVEECIVLDIREEKLDYESILGFIAFTDIVFPISAHEAIEVREGTILLNAHLRYRITRWRFTVAHELAHWILHRAYHCGDNRKYNFRQIGYSYISCGTDMTELGKKNPRVAKTDDEWAEWQADNLAAALLMPRDTFVNAAKITLAKHGFLEMYLVAGKDINRGMAVIEELADLFQVSMRSVRIRMRYFHMYKGDASKHQIVYSETAFFQNARDKSGIRQES